MQLTRPHNETCILFYYYDASLPSDLYVLEARLPRTVSTLLWTGKTIQFKQSRYNPMSVQIRWYNVRIPFLHQSRVNSINREPLAHENKAYISRFLTKSRHLTKAKSLNSRPHPVRLAIAFELVWNASERV